MAESDTVEEARAFLQSIVDTVREPLVVLDADLRVVSASRSFYQTFRVTPEETVGTLLYALGSGQWDIPALRRLLTDVLPAGSTVEDFTVEHAFPHIGQKTMLLNARTLYRPGNHTGMLLLAIEDVTERQQAAGALAHSEMRYRRLFETAPDGILLLDAETGRITDANPFLEEFLEYAPGEFAGRELWEIGLFSDQEASRAAFRQLQEQGYIRYEDLPLQTRRGERREVEFVSNVYQENGRAVIQCNIRDITERKRMEETLRAAFERERVIAETLQRPLTLEVAEDAFPGLAVATLYEAALAEAQVGGDFFDIFDLPGDWVALAIGDASGKGLSAAARAMQVKDVLRAFAREYPHSPAHILSRLNDFVCDTQQYDEQPRGEGFICLTLALLDTKTGEGAIISAGCEPPLLLRADGQTADVIELPNLPMGAQRGEFYRVMPLQLAPGDTLLLVTDGITEARAPERKETRLPEFLGYEGFTALAVAGQAAPDGIRAWAKGILDGARAFAGGALGDDACLLIARRRRPS